MAIFSPDYIVGDTCLSVPNATLYHLGVLQSSMHMAWVRSVCGRLKGDYRYSNEIVYNNYPWPEAINEKQITSIEKAIQKVLDVRNEFKDNTLAQLYELGKMPAVLVKAHLDLDKTVDLAYRSQIFINEEKRLEFLFGLHGKYTANLFSTEKIKKKKS